jgi:phage baseplate assembly protein W
MVDAFDAFPRQWPTGRIDSRAGNWTRHLPKRRADSAGSADGQSRAIARDWKLNNMNINFPFKFDGRGQTASANESQHIRQMIEQLIFTSPGERVNRPTFGSGVLQLIFAPNSPELAATVQFTMEAAIQQWLGDVIELETLEVVASDSALSIDLSYSIRRTNEQQTLNLTRAR